MIMMLTQTNKESKEVVRGREEEEERHCKKFIINYRSRLTKLNRKEINCITNRDNWHKVKVTLII